MMRSRGSREYLNWTKNLGPFIVNVGQHVINEGGLMSHVGTMNY